MFSSLQRSKVSKFSGSDKSSSNPFKIPGSPPHFIGEIHSPHTKQEQGQLPGCQNSEPETLLRAVALICGQRRDQHFMPQTRRGVHTQKEDFSLVVQVAKMPRSQCTEPGSILGREQDPNVPQLRGLHDTNSKIPMSQPRLVHNKRC